MKKFLLLLSLILLVGVWIWQHPSPAHSELSPETEPVRTDLSPKLPVGSVSTPLRNLIQEWQSSAKNTARQNEILQTYKQERLALMRSDPERFLETALTLSDFVKLPEEIQEAVGQPYSGFGEIRNTWATSIQADGTLVCTHRNRFQTDSDTLDIIHPTGKILPVRRQQAVSGYKLGTQLLISDDPVQSLDARDAEAAATIFPDGNPEGIDPVTGRPAENVTALIGGKLFRFSEPAIPQIVKEELQRENPRVFDWMAGDTGGDSGTSDSQATPYQQDQINVLFIRVDFSDFPGEPVSKIDLGNSLASVYSKIDAYSYGLAGLTYTVSDTVYRMPFTGAAYAQDFIYNENIQADARNLASADYNLADYDVIAVFFPNLSGVSGSKITYGGFADIGSRVDGASHWINGVNSVEIMLHEFGHNYGLYHANYYHPEEVLGDNNDYDIPSILEYGDIFDTMGDGNSPEAHFNPLAKNQLQWIPDSKIAEAAASGTWRIYRFDEATALSNPTLALKVPMAGNVNYWVGFRQLYTSSAYNLANAAYVVGENMGENRETSLIDMTPESQASESDDRKDAGLPVGGSFYDAGVGVTFEALAIGGSAPNLWIDVQITFDPRIGFTQSYLEIDEQAGTLAVSVSRTFNDQGQVSIDFATADGTATAPNDYYASSGTLTWADGDMADKNIILPIRPDLLNEGIEDFTLSLSNPSGGVLDGGAGTITLKILDPGQRYTSFDPAFFNTSVNSIVPLGNGQVIIGGNMGSGIGDFDSIRHIARLNADGSVDSSFVSGTGFNDEVSLIVRQPDGNLLVAGNFTSYNGIACPGLVRLSTNGALENAFVSNLGIGPNDDILAMAVENDGGILVGGYLSSFDGVAVEGMIRLNADGSRNTISPLSLPFDTGWGTEIYCILVESSGKIMVGGSLSMSWTGSGFRSGIARLNADGTRDSTFDPDAGAHDDGATNQLRRVYSIQKLSDGKYLIGGEFTAYDENPTYYIARILANGAFDNSFSPPNFNATIFSLLHQTNNKVLAGSWLDILPSSFIERLDNIGTVDSSYYQQSGPGGPVFTMAEDSKGQLWLGGNFFSYQGVTVRPVIRIAGGVSPYQLWVRENFTPAQIAAGDADPDADPDEDTITNLAEMAMSSNPNLADAASLFAVDGASGIDIIEDGGQNYLQITLQKSSDPDGPWYTAQFSGDLQTWSPVSPTPGSPEIVIVENSGTRFSVRDTVPISPGNPRFGRIILQSAE